MSLPMLLHLHMGMSTLRTDVLAMTNPAGEQRVEEIERDLSIPWADLTYTPEGASPHTQLNHVQAECPHPACRYYAAEGRLRDHVRYLLARLRAVEAERDARQGTESWRSCGHIAWGTCSTCYVERGKELSAAEAEARRLTAERDYWKDQYAEQMDRPCHVIQHEDQEIRLDRLTAEVARLREAAAVMLQECHDDIGGVYSSPGTRLLSAALTPPSPGGAPDA